MFNFENCSFSDFLLNLKAFKVEYQKNLTPFFNRVEIIRWKKYVYNLNISYDLKNWIWEYLNDDIPIDFFVKNEKKI